MKPGRHEAEAFSSLDPKKAGFVKPKPKPASAHVCTILMHAYHSPVNSPGNSTISHSIVVINQFNSEHYILIQNEINAGINRNLLIPLPPKLHVVW